MLKRSQTAHYINLEKPRLNTAIFTSPRNSVTKIDLKFPSFNNLSSSSNTKKALTTMDATQGKQQSHQTNESMPEIQKKKKEPLTSAYLKDIKDKNNFKARMVKQWAFKKVSNEELGLPPPRPITAVKSKEQPVTARDRINNQLNKLEDELMQLSQDELVPKINTFVNLAELDNDLRVLDDGTLDIDNRNPSLNISKEHNLKNMQSRIFDTQLIQLAKERFKTQDIMEYKKKDFVSKQLRKSKTLPGLKCEALIEYNKSQKLSRIQPKKNQVDLDFDDEIPSAKPSARPHTQKENATRPALDAMPIIKPKTAARVSFRTAISSSYRSRRSRFGVDDDDNMSQTSSTSYENKFNINDSRFVNLIDTVRPVYVMNEMKDINKIIENNEALKNTETDGVKIRRNRVGGKRLAALAKEILSSDDYAYGRSARFAL